MFERKILPLLILACIVGGAAEGNWLSFRSPGHFSVAYPAAWRRIGTSMDRLQILSSPGGAEGVIIKKGQAEITVMVPDESSDKTLAEVIDTYSQGTVVLSHRDIPVEREEQGCSQLAEVISKETAVPQEDSPIRVPHIINTDFFCEAQGHKIVVSLRNYEEDARQKQHQNIALRIAKSIRVSQ